MSLIVKIVLKNMSLVLQYLNVTYGDFMVVNFGYCKEQKFLF